MSREFWYKFNEEIKVKRTSVTTHQMVKVVENTDKSFAFEGNEVYSDTNFELGSFRIQPTGRMDRKGQIRVIGNLKATMNGTGKVLYSKERQPPSDNYARTLSEAEARTTFTLPIQFEVTIQHRTKPVQGSVTVKPTIDNPFRFEDQKEGEKVIFTHSVKASGSYKLTPLFQKK